MEGPLCRTAERDLGKVNEYSSRHFATGDQTRGLQRAEADGPRAWSDLSFRDGTYVDRPQAQERFTGFTSLSGCKLVRNWQGRSW
jgi:hypothetical protein